MRSGGASITRGTGRDWRFVVWKMTPMEARAQAELIRAEFPPPDVAAEDADLLDRIADEVDPDREDMP